MYIYIYIHHIYLYISLSIYIYTHTYIGSLGHRVRHDSGHLLLGELDERVAWAALSGPGISYVVYSIRPFAYTCDV